MDMIVPAGLANSGLAVWAEGQTNAALRCWDDVVVAEELSALAGLPLHPCRPKIWDTYLGLFHITRSAKPGPVLDAGAERYSALLPALAGLGYTELTGINLAFGAPERVGNICYEHGDITATRFADGAFTAITSLSVIEHGVDTAAFFREAARLLAPGGILFVSFDYWHEAVDTRGQIMYGAPVQIFGPDDWTRMLNEAAAAGLLPDKVPEMGCGEQVIHWLPTGLDYTFANMLFRKPETGAQRVVATDTVKQAFLGSGGETCAFLDLVFPLGLPETFRVAEIGVWKGDTSLAIANLMNNRGQLDLFDYQDVVEPVVARLKAAGYTNTAGHCNSSKTLDSYNWSLMKLLAQHDQPIFDYVYLDGSHTWAVDGFAFCLIDRLLKPGGFIDFDDYGWTYARSPGGNPVVRPATAEMFTSEQIETPQVDLIVNLLVRRDPRFQEILPNKIFLKTRS